MEQESQSAREVSYSYLAYVFGVGISLIAVLVYAGYSSWPVLPTLAVGAGAQWFFRVTKRMWRRSMGRSTPADDEEQVATLQGAKYAALIYIMMLVVCGVWYGIGRGIAWLAS